MKIYTPLEVSTSHTTIEHDRNYYWVVSIKLHISLSKSEVLFEQDCIEGMMASMGNQILPDMGVPKPNAEFLLNGHYYAPNQKPVIADQATVELHDLSKSINVFGDRHWFASVPTKPTPINKLPLTYEYAFGGEESVFNPVGKGFKEEALPNLEVNGQTTTSNNAHFSPAGFSPLDPAWYDRSKYQGTYDNKYLEKYFPGHPKDMDWRLFMSAPQDQWFNGYLKGNETFKLTNVHPEKPEIEGQLPDLRPRCFIKTSENKLDEGKISELNLNLDTVWFFPDTDTIQLVWRSMIPAQSDEPDNISHLLVGYESNNDTPRDFEHYRYALERRIENNDPLENNLTNKDLVPLGVKSSLDRLKDSALEDVKVDAFSENIKAKSDAITDAVNKTVDEQISATKEQLSASEIKDDLKQELLGKLGETSDISDPDIKAIMDKLEDLLPGHGSGNPNDVELGLFSFKKLDALMAEISKVTDKKKLEAIEQATPQIQSLKDSLNELDSGSELNAEDKSKLKEQIQSLDNLNEKPVSKPAPLPRFQSDEINATLLETSQEIKQAEKELHMQLSNPLLNNPDSIKKTQEKIETLKNETLSEISEQIESAKKQFFDAYLMGAHFSPDGLSPHSDVNIRSKAFFNSKINNQALNQQDWACIEFNGEDLSGLDLSDCYLEQVKFINCNLSNVNFTHSVLARAQFINSNCKGAIFNDANLGAIIAEKSDFSNCSLKNTKLSHSKFKECSFHSAIIADPELLFIELDKVAFDYATLENWSVIEREFHNLNFTHAKLTGCSFITCKLSNCDFSWAELPSTVWSDTDLIETSFLQSDISKNCFVQGEEKEVRLSELDFSGANFSFANLQNLRFKNCLFNDTNLSSSNLMGAILRENSFQGCQAIKTQFRKANLDQTVFTRSNLMEAIFNKAILTNVDFKYANLYGADFLKSTVEHTNFSQANLDATILVDWRPS